jgi:tetratricopeptide (TPR) repeat protein
MFVRSTVKAYSNLGLLLDDLNRYEEAEAVYRKAIEIAPSNPTIYSNLGGLLVELNRHEEAEIMFRKAIELDSKFYTAYYNLALLLRQNYRIEEMFPLLEKMTEIEPKDFKAYLEIVSIQKQSGKDISKNIIDNARQTIPDDNWYNRACLESLCGNFDLAFVYLQKAVQKDDEFDPKWAWEDPDLQWIRDDPRFTETVGPKSE